MQVFWAEYIVITEYYFKNITKLKFWTQLNKFQEEKVPDFEQASIDKVTGSPLGLQKHYCPLSYHYHKQRNWISDKRVGIEIK